MNSARWTVPLRLIESRSVSRLQSSTARKKGSKLLNGSQRLHKSARSTSRRRHLADPCAEQNFITFMDALKLKLRAKDQLHPLLTDLMSGYTRFKASSEWEGRPKILHWWV